MLAPPWGEKKCLQALFLCKKHSVIERPSVSCSRADCQMVPSFRSSLMPSLRFEASAGNSVPVALLLPKEGWLKLVNGSAADGGKGQGERISPGDMGS